MQKQSPTSSRPVLSQALCKGYLKKTGPQFYCSVFPCSVKYLFGQLGSAVPHQFHVHPQATHWDGWMRNREGLALERPIVWPDSFRYSICGGCNIEYQIYLKIIGITWDFWFSRVIQVTLKTQHKGKIHLDEYSSCRTSHSPNPNRIPGTGVYNILTITRLGVPHGQEGEHGLQPTQAHCSLRNSLASCVVYVLSVGLSHIFVASASTAQQ